MRNPVASPHCAHPPEDALGVVLHCDVVTGLLSFLKQSSDVCT